MDWNYNSHRHHTMETIRTVLIGFGYRGKRLWRLMQHIPYLDVVAIADPQLLPDEAAGVTCYSEGDDDYLRMLHEQRPALAIVASPWHCHVPQTYHCLQAGCHVGLEIKGGLSIDEYQHVSELAHAKRLNIYPLENTLFMRENLAIYNLVQEGVLGEVVHMAGGYRHDLRKMLIDPSGRMGNRHSPEGIWRSRFYETENGDLYPTHGLAPLCLIGNINRKDRIKSLTAFASKSAGIRQRIKELGGNEGIHISMGDIVTTELQTESGILISLVHDTTLPRPRSLGFEVQGTKGIWRGEHRQIYIEDVSPLEEWEPDAPYVDRYEHTYWRSWGEEALQIDEHHQGMDYIMLKALEADLKREMDYPATIEDLALWTSISPYSKLSIEQGKTIPLP